MADASWGASTLAPRRIGVLCLERNSPLHLQKEGENLTLKKRNKRRLFQQNLRRTHTRNSGLVVRQAENITSKKQLGNKKQIFHNPVKWIEGPLFSDHLTDPLWAENKEQVERKSFEETGNKGHEDNQVSRDKWGGKGLRRIKRKGGRTTITPKRHPCRGGRNSKGDAHDHKEPPSKPKGRG